MPTIAELARGRTQYALRGDREAKHLLVVCGGFHFPRNCDAFFDDLARELGDGWAVLTFDAWGRGGSDAPRHATWNAALYVEQVEGLLAVLGLGERSLALLGYSFGGAVATHAAARLGERVRALILSGAWATWQPMPAAARWTVRLGLGALIRRAWWPSVDRALKAGFEDPVRDAAYIARMVEVERRIVAADEVKFWRAILGTMRDFPTDTRRVVQALGQKMRQRPLPTLLAWGRSDNVSPVADARRIHAALPGSRLIELAGSHNDPWLVPGMREPLRDAFLRFLREHPP